MFKAAGAPCDLFREHLVLNQTTNYSSTAGTDSDFFRETANISGMPLRLAHVPDATAYGTQPKQDSWGIQLRQGWTPANKNGDGNAGALT